MKRKKFKITVVTLIILLFVAIVIKHYTAHSKNVTMLTHHSQTQIDRMVHSTMKKGDIPGVSVLIIKDNKVFMDKGYGYANVAQKKKVSPKTKFEIASNTKAFTGYAILQLVREGKVNLNDKVSKYIPDFYMKYDDEKQDITIKQLLGQTSGIPFDITEENHYSKDYNTIDHIVKYAKGKSLNHSPGETFEYSNMNYDILGLVIQNVSHESYISYIQHHILNPLNMVHTTFKTTNVKGKDDATGYELFNGNVEKSKPEFNIGDTPAAFMMSSTKDLRNWVKFQLKPPVTSQPLIETSHKAFATSIGKDDADGYGAGWFVNTDDNIIFHTGILDNFSSEILLNPKKSYGIVVLANMKSKQVFELANNINSQILNNDHYTTLEDKINQSKSEQLTTTIIAVLGTLLFTMLTLMRFIKLRRKLLIYNDKKQSFITFIIIITLFTLFNIVAYLLPIFIFSGASWSVILSWLPSYAKWLMQVSISLF